MYISQFNFNFSFLSRTLLIDCPVYFTVRPSTHSSRLNEPPGQLTRAPLKPHYTATLTLTRHAVRTYVRTSDSSNFRGIALSPVYGKIYDNIELN